MVDGSGTFNCASYIINSDFIATLLEFSAIANNYIAKSYNDLY